MEPDPAKSDEDEDSIESSRMTLSEHLSELRVRLIRSAIVFVMVFGVLYAYRQPVQDFIQRPQKQAWAMLHERLYEARLEYVATNDDVALAEYFADENGNPLPNDAVLTVDTDGQPDRQYVLREADKILQPMTSLQSMGPFFLALRVCFYLAMFIAGPYLIWELWMFVAAGLYKREKRIVHMALPPSLLLFFVGNAFGYYFMVPYAIYFTQSDGIESLNVVPRMMDYDLYFQWLRSLTLALGAVFQLPIIQVALSKIGLVDPKIYAKYRGHAAIGALVFAAIITPPDWFTQLLLAGPTIVLWEIGYWCSRAVWSEPEGLVLTDDVEPSSA